MKKGMSLRTKFFLFAMFFIVVSVCLTGAVCIVSYGKIKTTLASNQSAFTPEATANISQNYHSLSEAVHAVMSDYTGIITAVILFALAFGILNTFVVATRLIKPVHMIITLINEKIEALNLPPDKKSEIKQLLNALNILTEGKNLTSS